MRLMRWQTPLDSAGPGLQGLLRLVRWPLPALLAWALGWWLCAGLQALGLPALAAVTVSVVVNMLGALVYRQAWRTVIVAAGWPLSLLLLQPALVVPGWLWLGLLAALLTAYPLRAWRDAPWYPTPPGALAGLHQFTGRTGPGGRPLQVLDAGCGLGAGLRALHQALPQARLAGVEWSWPLWLLCRWRCRFAQVRRGDLWAGSWAEFDVVYLFQRPESMAPALAKAAREMHPGSWLISLAFDPELPAEGQLRPLGGRTVWVYRIPHRALPR